MGALYFAYGSNLDPTRMRARLPAAERIGPALLRGMRLAFDKRGADGSAKANLSEDAASHVWGALYTIESRHWPTLDGCEPDYQRVRVLVERNGARLAAETYVSALRVSGLEVRAWYRHLMLEGARVQGLPDAYVAQLERLLAREALD